MKEMYAQQLSSRVSDSQEHIQDDEMFFAPLLLESSSWRFTKWMNTEQRESRCTRYVRWDHERF